jgi:hypothetical protein
MVKKSKPSAKAESKPSVKAESKVSVKEETIAPVKQEGTELNEETIGSAKGGIIDFYLFFTGLGVLIGIVFIIVGILRYGLHIL